MQVNKLHLNCGTEWGYPGGIQRVNVTSSRNRNVAVVLINTPSENLRKLLEEMI